MPQTIPDKQNPPIKSSIAELLAGVTARQPLVANDGKSGNWLERVVIDNHNYIVKHHTMGADWLMRVSGDQTFWPYILWQSGFYKDVPKIIDHTIVGMALEVRGSKTMLAILMHDVGQWLIPEGDDAITIRQQTGFLSHMATLHSSFWNWQDDLGLQSMSQRILMFAPTTIAPELERPETPTPIRVAAEGWRRLPTAAPALAKLIFPFHNDPSPLIKALGKTPTTFVHGDWKLGNLGRRPDGRTILIDWAYPGAGPAAWDLVWYLALNCDRLPQSKEQSIAIYRTALETNGISTDGWWDRQLGLCFTAMMVVFGWEKAVGDPNELAWWQDRAIAGSHFL